MAVVVKYDSNNSGGYWWLDDNDWLRLEKAGWNIHWGKRLYGEDLLTPKEKTGERWLGALACSAAKEFDTPADAITEFERVTGQCASDVGCNCCGSPHSFEYEDENGETHFATPHVVATDICFS